MPSLCPPFQVSNCFAGLDFARGRVYETTDVDEARELCGRIFNPHQLQPRGQSTGFRSSMDHFALGPMSLNRLSWDSPVQVDPDRLDNYYLLSVPLRASARFQVGASTVEVSPRCAAVISAPSRFRFETEAFFDQIAVRLEEQAVQDAWAGLTGQASPQRIELAAALPMGGQAWKTLEPILGLLTRSCSETGQPALAATHLHARLQDMLLTTLLLHQSPQFLSAPAPQRSRASAALVRRAQGYLLENLTAPLTLTAMARASGVSSRTLQAAFHDVVGCGPMQWLRMQRLDAAHQALRHADEATQVTQTALAFGFTHLGEFSRLYRQRFGQSPSATLRGRG
jgi:AraC-like DNA-binding protein